MITLRCTRKLLGRAGVSAKADTTPPTTVLGDWYSNLITARPQQLTLCMNERSLLVVVLPARDFKNVAPRFRAQVVSLLMRIGVPAAAVAAEEKAMQEFHFGPTANRRVLVRRITNFETLFASVMMLQNLRVSMLGCLNEAAFALSYEPDNSRVSSIAELEDRFSQDIYSPTGYKRPRDLALELFAASGVATGASFHRIH